MKNQIRNSILNINETSEHQQQFQSKNISRVKDTGDHQKMEYYNKYMLFPKKKKIQTAQQRGYKEEMKLLSSGRTEEVHQ